MTRLSKLLNEAIDGGITVADALARMEREGVKVDRGQLYKAIKGNHAKNPSERVLQGWAIGFKIPVTELRKAVDAQAGELEPYEPPAFADRLTGDQRKALNEFIRTIVEAGTGDVAPAAKKTQRARGSGRTSRTKPKGQ